VERLRQSYQYLIPKALDALMHSMSNNYKYNIKRRDIFLKNI